MNIFEVLKNDAKKAISWFKNKEQDFIDAMQHASKITSSLIDFVKTNKDAIAIEKYVSSIVPQGQTWTDEVIKILTIIGKDMAAVSSKEAILGIALRLGSEVLAIIHGKKLKTIDDYILEFQKIFIG